MSQSRNTRRNRLSAASHAGQKRTPFGLVGSLLLHGAVIAATFFTWQHKLLIADKSPPVVPVELVTIASKTNITPEAPDAKFKPTKTVTQIAPPNVQDNIPPPEQMAAPKIEMAPPPPKAEPAPPPPKAEPAPPPPEEATSEPLVKTKPKVVPAQPTMRPSPPRHERKKAQFNVNNILALLNKQKAGEKAPPRGKVGANAHRGIGAQNAMTMDLADALRNEIAQCWSPPVGAPNPDSLVVSFRLYLNPDGSVAQPPQLTGQSGSGAYIQAAIDAARRAIYTCAPYKLPADRYNEWHDITLTFDPRKMMGE